MIEVGQRVQFVPYWDLSKLDDARTRKAKTVVGVVTEVNVRHRLFYCSYNRNGVKYIESFKFQDIGDTVWRA
jgi:hypothetical protein